jgi:hypothetical protein
MTVRLSSTTDGPAEVRAALGLSPEEPETVSETTDDSETSDQATATNKASLGTKTVNDADDDADTDADDDTGETELAAKDVDDLAAPKTKKGGVDKRINKLTAKNYELLEQLRQRDLQLSEAQAIRGGDPNRRPDVPAVTQPTAKTIPELRARPDFEKGDATGTSYRTYESFLTDLGKWSEEANVHTRLSMEAQLDNKLATERNRIKEERIADTNQQAAARINQESIGRRAEASSRYEDFDNMVDAPIPGITDPRQLAVIGSVIRTHKQGWHMGYYLSKHPEEVVHIASLHPDQQKIELGAVIARLGTSTDQTNTALKPKKSKAPPPITQTKSRGSKSSLDLSDPNISYRDYKAAREAQTANR